MKTMKAVFAMMVIVCGMITTAGAQDFSDMKSYALTAKAWDAANSGNHELVMAYTNKCIDTYLKQAKEMQSKLTALPKGSQEEVSKLWALNDVGTCLFIQGEALMKKGDTAGAKKAFSILVNELKYAQCWDTKGWFWQPAGAAKAKLVGLESGF